MEKSEAKVDYIEDDEDGEEQEEEEMKEEEKNERLIKACKENNFEDAQYYISIQAIPTCEKDGWTPLLWASINGNEQIVRLLIKHNACAPYLNQNQEDLNVGQPGDNDLGQNFAQIPGQEEFNDPFVKPKDARKVGKYTPLHWASYKGHYKVVWLLLKEKMSPLDIDMHGNTAVHQAAASGSKKVLECFLSRGVDVDVKNARGHAPLDLATAPEVKELIQKAINTKNCVICKSKFDFKNIRYYCESCERFLCINCSKSQWVYESVESEDKERPVCRCNNCLNSINQCEDDLVSAMKSMKFHTVDAAYSNITNSLGGRDIDIDVKLKNQAEILHLKLEKELDIKNFINSVAQIGDYKTILKSVKILNDKVENAQNLGVDLDAGLMQEVNMTTSRLISERNLRFQMEMVKVSSSDNDQVDHLKNLIEKAQENGVEDQYRDFAERMQLKMNGNIRAREILQLMLDYPEREYPEPVSNDPKKKKQQKLEEEKKKKKKKKKEPPFPIPEWALETDQLEQHINQMNSLIGDADNLELNEPFVLKVNDQLKRFKKEIAFRRQQEEEKRQEELLKKQKKNQKKK